MPFKTKKQKIRALKKRVVVSNEGIATYQADSKNFEVIAPDDIKPSKESKMADSDYSYVGTQLAKIGVLAFLIIGLQIILRVADVNF